MTKSPAVWRPYSLFGSQPMYSLPTNRQPILRRNSAIRVPWGRNVQRTMRLLATSTPQKRNTVRILFYGQSITEQKWWQAVADDLRARFPNANLVIENRALGGFASQMLVKTAETDLYPFYPDLLIFQVYGAHDKYEDIIRRVRERTTAEILQQNDHVTNPADFSEETDPAKLWPPNGKHWDAFMNHNWLPAVSKRYGTELCDQRSLWKRYLTDNRPPTETTPGRRRASERARRVSHGPVRQGLPALRPETRSRGGRRLGQDLRGGQGYRVARRHAASGL